MRGKRVVVLLLAMVLLAGCAEFKSFFCSPTAEQVMAAAEKLDQATAALAFLQDLVPVPEVAAAIAALQIAIPILRQIKDGICVSAADEANASLVAKSSLRYAATMGFSGGK
jgi:hypothetical protein